MSAATPTQTPHKEKPMGFRTGLTFTALRHANTVRAKEAKAFEECKKWTPSDWVVALVGEVGEACNIWKKVRRGDFTLDEKREDIAKELADAQIYLDLLAKELGISLGKATQDKFNEVSKRVGAEVYLHNDDWHRYP